MPPRPSRTAHLIALGRAHADAGFSHVPGFHDPTARHFLDARGTRSLERTVRAAQDGKPGMRERAARTMADLMALRTTAIDGALRDAIARGARQLVILGAGYDGRAWRMHELAGVTVYEVDRIATQREKRARAVALPPPAGDVRFVPIDFEHESLDDLLARAGHDASAPTCWIWEGVVMYLTRDAFLATLNGIARRSAPGSTLILNYHAEHKAIFARLVLRVIGEPQVSVWSPDEMANDLRRAGFRVAHDSGMLDWNSSYAQGEGRVGRASYMRVVVAERE